LICISWAKVLGPGAGPLLLHVNSENVKKKIKSSLLPNVYENLICMIMMFMKLCQDLSIGSFIFALMTLTLEFDLLLKNFNMGHIS
jgi:hypothetical protein